jgi:hypothetical protein
MIRMVASKRAAFKSAGAGSLSPCSSHGESDCLEGQVIWHD